MRRRERGVALIMVLLVVLVLTGLGIAAAILMTQEDRTSARQELSKAALYSAEAGLRQGERVLSGTYVSALSAVLGNTGCSAPQNWRDPSLRSTGCPDEPTRGDPSTWTVAHLGTYLIDSNTLFEYANQFVGSGASGRGRMYYSLYVRNNPGDPGTTVTTDTDAIVRLVSVGFVMGPSDSAAPLAVKIIEEEINVAGGHSTASLQKLVDQGGTSSGTFK